jgi:predicted NUDIX family NTP pyrophosphohydrolase
LALQITGLAGATTYEMPAAHIVLLCMETSRVSGELRLSEEHDDFAWVPLEELTRWNNLLETTRPVLNGLLKRKEPDHE